MKVEKIYTEDNLQFKVSLSIWTTVFNTSLSVNVMYREKGKKKWYSISQGLVDVPYNLSRRGFEEKNDWWINAFSHVVPKFEDKTMELKKMLCDKIMELKVNI